MNAFDQSLSEISAPWQQPARARHGRRGRLIPVLAAIFLLAGVGLWHLQMLPYPVGYDTAPVIRRDLENTVTASGHIEPKAYVDVGAQVSGQLQRLYVAAWDQVEAGQLLTEIDAEVQAGRVIRVAEGQLVSDSGHIGLHVPVPLPGADHRVALLPTLREAVRSAMAAIRVSPVRERTHEIGIRSATVPRRVTSWCSA